MLIHSDPFKFLQFAEGSIYDRIPDTVKSNLANGTAIEFDPHKEHFCYPREYIYLVLKYILENDDLLPIYTNAAFRENIKCYLENFILPYLGGPCKTPQLEFIQLDSNKEFEDIPECTLLHGRYNGVPHPGYVRSLRHVRQHFGLPVSLGIETDDYSINSGQLPFLDVAFRASMLWYTGTIDRLVIINAPFHETADSDIIDWYWDLMYGVDTFLFNPRVVVAHGEEDYARKLERAPSRLNIHILDMLHVDELREFHMSDLRNNSLTPDEVRDCWEIAMGI